MRIKPSPTFTSMLTRRSKLPLCPLAEDPSVPTPPLKKVNEVSENDPKPLIVKRKKRNASTSKQVFSMGNGSDDEVNEHLERIVEQGQSSLKQKSESLPRKPYNSKKKQRLASLDQLLRPLDSSKPFEGFTFVLTGIFQASPEREKIEEALEALGAKCTGSVSRSSDLLIYSPFLEDGRNYTQGRKFKCAKEFGTLIASETEFSNFCEKLLKKSLQEISSSETKNSSATKSKSPKASVKSKSSI